MVMYEFLKDLKEGDRVVVSGGYHYHLEKIERLTKTQFVLTNGTRYRRKDGWRVGDHGGYSRAHLVEATEDRVNEIRQTNLAYKLGNVKWKEVPLDTMLAVLELL